MSRDRVPPDHDAEDASLEALVRAAVEPLGRCPDLTVLVDAGAAGDERVAGHVASCGRCRSTLAGLASPRQPLPGGARGDHLLTRAREIPDRVGVAGRALDLVVRVVGDVLEVIQGAGVTLQPAPVRGASDAGVVVERRLEGLGLRAHLSYSRTGGFGILLDVQREDPHTGPIRITLRRASRELRSDVCDGGPVLFPGVRPGRYRLDLRSDGGPAGHLDLDLEA